MGPGEVRNKTRGDLWQSGAFGLMEAYIVQSFRIPGRFRHYSGVTYTNLTLLSTIVSLLLLGNHKEDFWTRLNVVGVANWMVRNLVLEDMTFKVVELAVTQLVSGENPGWDLKELASEGLGFIGLIPLLNEPAGFRKLERGLPLELLTAFIRLISRDLRSLFDHSMVEIEWCGLVPNSCLTQHKLDRAGDLLENDKI
ncbi:hypothetical protein LguiA_011273 [Lonicera macranthoides]